MEPKLKQDLDWFFEVYRNRTAGIVNQLPAPARKLLIDELKLCMDSVYNRINEEFQR